MIINNIFINMLVLLAIVIVCLTLFAFFTIHEDERYNELFASDLLNNRSDGRSGQIAFRPYTSIANHVTLNKYGRPDNISTRPPQPRPGETKCTKCTCPTYVAKDSICWKCE